MSYHYDNRRRNDFGGGPIAKKQRIIYAQEDDISRLKSFKEFVLTLHDNIEENDACKLYNDYKIKIKRLQIEKFFEQHKDEEWFRNKYRPPEKDKIQADLKDAIAKRKEIYNLLKERQMTDGIKIAYEDQDKLFKFLDKFSAMLEGASIDEIEGDIPAQYGTSSIFIPQLHPSVDKAMIEEFAKTHEGFLRVSIAEPQIERGFRMRAWITFKQMDPDALRQLCWDFNRQKFNGHETKAIVNREMNNRIRYSHYWFCHKKCAAADVSNIAKLITYYEGEDCPLLENIKNHLVGETNAEEKVLLGEGEEEKFQFEQDEELLEALDEIILYLRVVHSFDYYAATEYVGEDDMPQKVGVMFSRPAPPLTSLDSPEQALREFIEAQEIRIKSAIEKPVASAEEQTHLGKRNSDEQIENFIYQHTQETKPGKFECTLTKKKFLAPEYVRKHILNRCADKIDEVRHDTEFFNNYIADSRRPL